MVNASNLPIQEITQKNFIEQWKSILTAIDSSTFIAIDLVRKLQLKIFFFVLVIKF